MSGLFAFLIICSIGIPGIAILLKGKQMIRGSCEEGRLGGDWKD